MSLGKLTLFAGKMGAGKSTHSQRVAEQTNAVLISEDEWLGALYPNQITSLNDYIRLSNVLKPQIKSLAQQILQTGSNVVLDYPANTVAQRTWLQTVFAEVGAPHELIYLEASDAICLAHIEKRRVAQPHRQSTDTKAMFEAVTQHFVVPLASEGFTITRIQVEDD